MIHLSSLENLLNAPVFRSCIHQQLLSPCHRQFCPYDVHVLHLKRASWRWWWWWWFVRTPHVRYKQVSPHILSLEKGYDSASATKNINLKYPQIHNTLSVNKTKIVSSVMDYIALERHLMLYISYFVVTWFELERCNNIRISPKCNEVLGQQRPVMVEIGIRHPVCGRMSQQLVTALL